MKTKNSRFFRLFCIVGFGMIFSLACISTVSADRVNSDSGDGSGQVVNLSKQRVTLTKKNSKMVSTAIGERFKIDAATLIVAEDGKQVSIFRLLVPCEVNLTLTGWANGQQRLVRRIDVLGTADNATNDMWNEHQ